MLADFMEQESFLIDRLITNLSSALEDSGFEISPFLTGWYNEVVSPRLRFDKAIAPHDDCLALCIINTPKMFERSFLRNVHSWFQSSDVSSLHQLLKSFGSNGSDSRFTPTSHDPFDWSVRLTLHSTLQSVISDLHNCLSPLESECLRSAQWIPDFSIRPVSRLPYVHVQAAGHVSGMAYFHRPDFDSDTAHNSKTSHSHHGLSLHPIYGGWFGFRGVYLFPNLRCPNLPKVEPVSPIYPGHPPFPQDKLEQLFLEYNEHVRENKWREFGKSNLIQHRYSSAAQTYFSTPPSNRNNLLGNWFKASIENSGESAPF